MKNLAVLSLLLSSVALGQQPAPVNATPIAVKSQSAGAVEPSQQTGTAPGLPGVAEPRSVASASPVPTARAPQSTGAQPVIVAAPSVATSSNLVVETRSVGRPYTVSGAVVNYEPGRSIALKSSKGLVRTIALPSTLNPPPDLAAGRVATVTLQRMASGSPRVLSIAMGR